MNDPLRVGLIRCDTHGMWYGPQMQDHDPFVLERPMTFDQDKQAKYSWMTRGVHYFFYTHYSAPRRMTAPRVDGFEIVKLWDEDRSVAKLAARVFLDKPRVCDSPEQVSDDVDLVFLADCNGDGGDHLQLAAPGLQKGVATFVDKPFAHCTDDVKKLQDLAKRHNAPVMSLSMLQTNPAAARIARRLEEVGEVQFGTITCASMEPAALIHAICLAQHVFGVGVQTVSCLRTPRHNVVHLDYGERTDRPEHGVDINVGVANFRFTEMFVCAYGPEGAIQGKALDDFNASEGSAIILEHVKEMVHTRQPHSLGEEMITAVAVMDAVRQAAADGRSVTIEEPSP